MGRIRYQSSGNKHRCLQKVQLSKRDAVEKARAYNHATGDLMKAYSCSRCGHWHIGHSNERKPSYTKKRRVPARQARVLTQVKKQLRCIT